MATNSKQSIASFLQQVRVGVQNAQEVPEIAAALNTFGFDAARVQAGADLLAQAESLHAVQVQEYSEQYAATTALKEAWDAADETYGVHRKLAKLALRADPDGQKALLLHERKPKTLDPWLRQAQIFYQNALGNPLVQTELARYNVTAALLEEGQTAVNKAARLDGEQEQEKSDAQRATTERDKVLDALDDWYTEFRELAPIALAADPQRLEALALGPIA